MESIGASPETPIQLLIARAAALAAEASALFAKAMVPAEGEMLIAALSNVGDGLMEVSAALRYKQVDAGVLALADSAGDARGYERGFRDGQRAARRGRAAHLAIAHRAAG